MKHKISVPARFKTSLIILLSCNIHFSTDNECVPIIFLCRKRVSEYEEIIVTPIHPPGDFESSQITEENEDFAGRQRFHQTANVQPIIGKQIRPSDSVQILQ